MEYINNNSSSSVVVSSCCSAVLLLMKIAFKFEENCFKLKQLKSSEALSLLYEVKVLCLDLIDGKANCVCLNKQSKSE